METEDAIEDNYDWKREESSVIWLQKQFYKFKGCVSSKWGNFMSKKLCAFVREKAFLLSKRGWSSFKSTYIYWLRIDIFSYDQKARAVRSYLRREQPSFLAHKLWFEWVPLSHMALYGSGKSKQNKVSRFFFWKRVEPLEFVLECATFFQILSEFSKF